MKKLYKSKTNKVLSGVLAGVAEYYDLDATIVRLSFILIAILTHGVPALIAYFLATLIVPERPEGK